MKRDILDELARGEITANQAQLIHDDALAAGAIGLGEGLGMSNVEYTAYAQGVGLPEIAKWRQSGWPSKCVVCGGGLEAAKFGWMAKEIGPDKHALEHIECPIAAARKT